MKFSVEITDTAWDEIKEAYSWLEKRAPVAAQRWQEGLLEAVEALESLPSAHSIAPESGFFGREIRQLLYGKRQHKYRVLFEIKGNRVIVLRVRHGARQYLGE
jgi:plasmid stabilization system protein ParE